MRDDRERLQDIIEAIAQIEKYAIQGKAKFQQDELIQIWIVHHLQIIGEACSKISNKLTSKYSTVPWAKIIAFRNIIVHKCFRLDLKIIWKTIVQDLPILKKQTEIILKDL